MDLSERCSGLEDQDFCYRAGLRYPDHPFPGLEKGITCLGGLSEQQRMAKGTGTEVAGGVCLGSGWGGKIEIPLKPLQRWISSLASGGLRGEGGEQLACSG